MSNLFKLHSTTSHRLLHALKIHVLLKILNYFGRNSKVDTTLVFRPNLNLTLFSDEILRLIHLEQEFSENKNKHR